MNKIIFDVTYLAHWQGNLTGITRMISELVLRYEKNTDYTFVIWDAKLSKFFETGIKETLSNHGTNIIYKTNEGNLVLNKDTFLIKAARKLETYKIPFAMGAHKALLRLNSRNLKKIAPKDGDVLFVPMGEWANESYTNRIVELSRQKIKVIQVIHDMLPLVTPQYSGHSTEIMDRYCRKVLPICSLVLAVSESTKRDLISWLKTKKLKIPAVKVFRHGEDFAFTKPIKPFKAVFRQSGDFILCVGTIEARKNHTLLYYVYKLAKLKNISMPNLVVVGRRGWRTDNFYDIVTSDPDTKDKINILSDINDNELYWLYENCMFTIYPSFYEGWGMPIAESISHNKPCLASSTSSMTEIAGDLISYFNPASTDECLDAIQKMLNLKNLDIARKKLRKYSQTNWDDTAKKVNQMIMEV